MTSRGKVTQVPVQPNLASSEKIGNAARFNAGNELPCVRLRRWHLQCVSVSRVFYVRQTPKLFWSRVGCPLTPFLALIELKYIVSSLWLVNSITMIMMAMAMLDLLSHSLSHSQTERGGESACVCGRDR